MKFTRPLDDIFTAPSNVKVLRILARSEIQMTGRQVAQMAGLNAMTCQNTLNRLCDMQLVSFRGVGSANLHWLDKNNFLVNKLILPLFADEGSLLDSLLEPTIKALSVVATRIRLFGSTARGDEKFGSDIDLCVVVRAKKDIFRAQVLVDQELIRITDESGIVPTILLWTEKEYKDRVRRKDALVMKIIREGRSLLNDNKA